MPTTTAIYDNTTFPYTLTISIPLPTHRLAHIALRALQVDAELSPLVKRNFSLARPHPHPHPNSYSNQEPNRSSSTDGPVNGALDARSSGDVDVDVEAMNGEDHAPVSPPTTANVLHHQSPSPDEDFTVLKTKYRATTNRMLRVAVNGFMESLGVVVGVMEELDGDVLDAEGEAEG